MAMPAHDGPTHSDAGLKRLLTVPALYRQFGRLLGGAGAVQRFAREHVRATPESRLLDLGCGPGDLASYLPHPITEYYGIDFNPAYIAAARARWKGHDTMSFACGDLTTGPAPQRDHYDVVVALAILHHLDDASARHLCSLAFDALRPGGRFVAYDAVNVAGQHPIARWMISKDRGRAVRTVDGYRQLAATAFRDIEGEVLHDTLRIPYTVYVMTATK